MAMFSFTAVWATNIHDAVPGNTEPVMGAKYHTVRSNKITRDRIRHYNRAWLVRFLLLYDCFSGTCGTGVELSS